MNFWKNEMNLLIKNIEEVQCDPDYPMVEVTVDGKDLNVIGNISDSYSGYLRGRINHATSIKNKLTLIIHNEFHLKLYGPDVLRLQIGDYLVPESN